jgi:hypothetical protein
MAATWFYFIGLIKRSGLAPEPSLIPFVRHWPQIAGRIFFRAKINYLTPQN